MEDAEGVAAEGGVGVAMFNGGGGFLSSFSPTFSLLCRAWLGRCIEVPHWGGRFQKGVVELRE